MDKQIKQEKTDLINAKLVELEEKEMIEEIIKNNLKEFVFEDEKYRVRRPKGTEKEELAKVRRRKYIELVEDPNNKLKNELIAMYEKRGTPETSISDLETKLLANVSKENDLLIKLAETSLPKDVKTLKDEIINLREIRKEIKDKIDELLDCCVEKQVFDYMNSYMTYYLLEKEIEGKWIRAFNSYEDFINTDKELLLIQSAFYLSFLIYKKSI